MRPFSESQNPFPGYGRIIVIGNRLKSSPGFPPLHTVHAAFTAHGVPSIKVFGWQSSCNTKGTLKEWEQDGLVPAACSLS